MGQPAVKNPKPAGIEEDRPVAGNLIVPYMVDASRTPIDFKAVDPDHVKRCATARRCGICGRKIRSGPLAFIGPNDGAPVLCGSMDARRVRQTCYEPVPVLIGPQHMARRRR